MGTRPTAFSGSDLCPPPSNPALQLSGRSTFQLIHGKVSHGSVRFDLSGQWAGS